MLVDSAVAFARQLERNRERSAESVRGGCLIRYNVSGTRSRLERLVPSLSECFSESVTTVAN